MWFGTGVDEQCVCGSCSFPLSPSPSCLVLRLVEQRVKEEEGEGQRESAGKAFGFKHQAWRKTLRNTTRAMNGYGWGSFCRRQGPACHAPRLRQQLLALEKQNQPLEVQPTLQLAHPLELAPPLDLSPRLDGERLRLHPYSPSGRNGYKKRKGSINRT